MHDEKNRLHSNVSPAVENFNMDIYKRLHEPNQKYSYIHFQYCVSMFGRYYMNSVFADDTRSTLKWLWLADFMPCFGNAILLSLDIKIGQNLDYV